MGGSKKRKIDGAEQSASARRKKEKKPHFFKILLDDFHHRLRIPPAFMKHISNEASDRVVLSIQNGTTSWSVSLDRTINGTFLSSGWQSFVNDCALKEYEFLLFCYDGDMKFTVLLFDKTACQRNVEMLMDTDDDPKRNVGLEEQEIPASDAADGKCLPYSEVRDRVKTEVEDIDDNAECVTTSKGRSPKKRHTTQQKLEAEKAAGSFCSEFPYFVKRMVECNVSKSFTLRVPAEFSRAHFPDKRTKIVVRDPAGRAWIVTCIPGTTCMISGGWTAFVRGNNLKEGDFCAFEKIGPVELRVTIFRIRENPGPAEI